MARNIPHIIIEEKPPATAAVLAAITDKFVEDEDGSLWMLNCPVEESSFYDIYKNDDGTFFLTVDDEYDDSHPSLERIPNLDIAKEEIAAKIAKKIEDARNTLSAARDYGIKLDDPA